LNAGARIALPPIARALGYAGLVPQVAAAAALATGDLDWRFTALAAGFFYAALIFAFLGGCWWGVAAARPDRAPLWLWVAAITPALVSLATAIPWMVGWEWPGPSLVVLGLGLIISPAVDRRLVALGLCRNGWLGLRLPLSIGLGGLTLLLAAL